MNWNNFAKYARAQALINMGGVVVYADTRDVSCQIYSTARGHETALAFSTQSTPPMPDLDCTTNAISGTLVFSGAYHHCVIPWDLVWAVRLAGTNDVTDGLILWADSVPLDSKEPELVAFVKKLGAWKESKTT